MLLVAMENERRRILFERRGELARGEKEKQKKKQKKKMNEQEEEEEEVVLERWLIHPVKFRRPRRFENPGCASSDSTRMNRVVRARGRGGGGGSEREGKRIYARGSHRGKRRKSKADTSQKRRNSKIVENVSLWPRFESEDLLSRQHFSLSPRTERAFSSCRVFIYFMRPPLSYGERVYTTTTKTLNDSINNVSRA
ncbi:uncharacterized protein [Venturia canescens]|uniref:uncharacterized protein n=1 Tax=Venturia canescens TaxID=32260 RepID=UPI001C9BC4CD|nr:uncharacterized protein LOC122416560 [Venturia canescens]